MTSALVERSWSFEYDDPYECATREMTLAHLERALEWLREVEDVQAAKQVHDIAKAAEVYAQEQKLGHEIKHRAHAIKTEAMRRIGELLTQTERAVGGRPAETSSDREPVSVPTLRDLGLDKKFSMRAQQLSNLAALYPDGYAQVRDGRKTLDRAWAIVQREIETERWFQRRAQVSREATAQGCDRNFRVCLRADLRNLHRADAIVTELTSVVSLEQLEDFAATLTGESYPVTIVCVPTSDLRLPDVLGLLARHLTYRGVCHYSYVGGNASIDRGAKLLFAFCPQGQAVKRQPAKSEGGWARYIVRKFAEEDDLVIDPFMTPETALAAMECGRRFIGGTDDPAIIADPREWLKGEWLKANVRSSGSGISDAEYARRLSQLGTWGMKE